MKSASQDEGERPAAAAFDIVAVDSNGDEARRCLAAYFAELSSRFEQVFDPARGVSANEPPLAPPAPEPEPVAEIVPAPLPPGMKQQPSAVKQEALGRGLSRRLLQELETRAAGMGMLRLRLDTNHTLAEAQALYRSAGYREIARFNDNPYADFWFEKQLAAG